MNKEEVKQLIAAAIDQQKQKAKAEHEKLKNQMKSGNVMARELKLKQETAKFAEPGDKKAVKFLWEGRLDLAEISGGLHGFVWR